MRLFALLFFSVCLSVALALVPLKHASLGQEYSIGKIWDMHFMPDGRIFFRSEDDLFGFLDGKNGRLLSVYELEDSEQIVEFVRRFEVIIAKGKSLNMFLPDGERYFRLIETQHIQDFNFTQILSYKRAMNGSYVLTDAQLISLPARLDPRKSSAGKQILLREANEKFVNLQNRLYKQKFDIVLVSMQTDERKVCFRSVMEKMEKKCLELPEKKVLVDVVALWEYIYVEFEDSVWVFDEDLKKISELDDAPQQYHNGLVVLGGKGEDHTYFDPKANTLYSSRIIAQDEPSVTPELTMKVQSKSLLIQRKAKDVVTITKEENQQPRKVWAQWNTSDPNQHRLYVEYEDNSLVCYLISEQKHTYGQVWKIATQVAKREVSGTIKEGDESEADIAEEKKLDKKLNGEEYKEVIPPNPEAGKEQAMKDALAKEEQRQKLQKIKKDEADLKGDEEKLKEQKKNEQKGEQKKEDEKKDEQEQSEGADLGEKASP